MIIKLSRVANNYGWREQMEIDTDAKTFKRGPHLFVSGDIDRLTKKQLDCTQVLLTHNGFTLIK